MRRFATVLLALALFVAAGCSKPPIDEEKRAFDALDLAHEAEADTYAPQAFATAQDTLDAGVKERERQDERFKLFRSYGKARQRFLRAESLARHATGLAGDEKDRLADECRLLVQHAAVAVDSCAILLDKAPSGKGARADLRMLREDLVTLATELGEASDDLDNYRFAQCRLKADSVLQKAAMVREEITAAIQKRK